MLQHADQQAGDDIDAGDQHAGHRIALREPAGAVHGAEELRFARQFLAAAPRASASSISPAFRSESIDICLPGKHPE